MITSKARRGMAENLNGKKRAADRSNDGVHSVPGGIDPGDFVGKKFQEVENARDGNDDRVAENFERLVGRARARSNVGLSPGR